MPGTGREIINGLKMTKKNLAGIPRLVLAVLLFLLSITSVPPGQQTNAAGDDVDLVLLLALDVSASVDSTEYSLMTEGLAEALSSETVGDTIRSGKIGAIAISVMQWSGFQEQEVKIKWTRVSDRTELIKLAEQVRVMKRRYKGGATDIGGAIKFSRELVHSAPFRTARRTIDIAGDGANNVNDHPSIERDITIKSNIIINGLAVTGQAIPLVRYYTHFVIGGPSAFVEEARDYDSFGTAMRRKLIREIGSQFLF